MPNTQRPTAHGFTLIEILIVIGIIATLMGFLLGPILNGLSRSRQSAAKIQMQTLSMSMAAYVHDWSDFPPLDPAQMSSSRAASEYLYTYLCVPHPHGEQIYGPYFTGNESSIQRDSNGKAALISPLNNLYFVGFEGNPNQPAQWILVDPGLDRLLGGKMDAEKGFIPDNSDTNGDTKADHLDNIIEKISLR